MLELPARSGPGPRTTLHGLPHQQLDQQPSDRSVRDDLARRVFELDGVQERPSGISVPGARALWLTRDTAKGPPEAFLVGTEFAHMHPEPDFSLHLALPTADADAAIAAGWAEWHPLVPAGQLARTVVMVYAPRTADEAAVVERLVERSWRFARGELT